MSCQNPGDNPQPVGIARPQVPPPVTQCIEPISQLASI